MSIRRLILLLLLIHSLLAPSMAVQANLPAQTTLEISGLTVSYRFGESAHFEAQVTPLDQVQEIHLMIQPQGTSTRVELAAPNAEGKVALDYDLAARPLRAFSPVEYWLVVTLKDGSQVESSRESFLYEDNRFEWQYIDNKNVVAKWYSGDLTFGQIVVDTATSGLEKAQETVDAPAPQPLRVYVYPTSDDLQSALKLINASWLAGHASPEFATVLISVAPGPTARLELERQLPHEITHILLYQAYGDNYARLPQWLNEGLASLSEIYPNSDYARVLEKAASNGSLLPMQSLCNEFPREASGALLAYAQSESFVRFLSQKFGYDSLHKLAAQYADGVDCLQGVQTVYESSLDQLELRWKQEFLEINAGQLAWQNLLPYLVVMLLVLVPAVVGGVWIWRRK